MFITVGITIQSRPLLKMWKVGLCSCGTVYFYGSVEVLDAKSREGNYVWEQNLKGQVAENQNKKENFTLDKPCKVSHGQSFTTISLLTPSMGLGSMYYEYN